MKIVQLGQSDYYINESGEVFKKLKPVKQLKNSVKYRLYNKQGKQVYKSIEELKDYFQGRMI